MAASSRWGQSVTVRSARLSGEPRRTEVCTVRRTSFLTVLHTPAPTALLVSCLSARGSVVAQQRSSCVSPWTTVLCCLNIGQSTMPSRKRKRSVEAAAGSLELLVRVAYGTVLAAIAFTIGQTLLHWDAIAARPSDPQLLDTVEVFQRLIVSICFSLMVAKDLADGVRLNVDYPMRRYTRYWLECAIVLSYDLAFLFLTASNWLALAWFASALAFGGVWCNQLRLEYRHDDPSLGKVMAVVRTLHYYGTVSILALTGLFMVFDAAERTLTLTRVIAFAITFGIWYLIQESVPFLTCGLRARRYLVTFVVSGRFLRKLSPTRRGSRRKDVVLP